MTIKDVNSDARFDIMETPLETFSREKISAVSPSSMVIWRIFQLLLEDRGKCCRRGENLVEGRWGFCGVYPPDDDDSSGGFNSLILFSLDAGDIPG
jgi:hypothetical protein